ncbi:hypothetical protein [uncultured Ilyobacter sp.]|uniref:hypothetical protein n=1 Tax=uncultured Ilyobacter sp. TaxID=544433 RepID=UPI0029C01F66|nr:hypothetical protein [uncultured Ilyobacter sp.]
MKEVNDMGIINILALNEREIETIKLLLEYAEKKAKNEEMKLICSQLLEKISLKYYFSPEEDGKLKGLSPKARSLYYEFYEKYDFDLIDFVGRISQEYRAPNDIYKALLRQFPISTSFFKGHPQEIIDIIIFVLDDSSG